MTNQEMDNTKCLIILSWKRYAGKDYIGLVMEKELRKKFNCDAKFIHATTEIKREFAKQEGLDFNELSNDRMYKETYREKMTEFANNQKNKFGECYYDILLKNNILDRSTNPTIYIVDVRYKFEIDYYRILNIPLVLIRINVDDRIKKKRGWKFDPKIDNDDSETNLDNYHNWN